VVIQAENLTLSWPAREDVFVNVGVYPRRVGASAPPPGFRPACQGNDEHRIVRLRFETEAPILVKEKGRRMSIDINPETESVVRDELGQGHFRPSMS